MDFDHEQDFPVTLTGQILDKLMASALVLCTIVGVPGNLLALRYFWTCKRRTLAVKLYIAIATIDICTCIAHFPVAVCLFSVRHAQLFGYEIVCASWAILFQTLQRVSMFLVMLLSASRALSIACPFTEVNTNAVLGSFFLYIATLVVHDMVITAYGIEAIYMTYDVYCWTDPITKSMEVGEYAFVAFVVGVPPIVCVISFVVCVVKLAQSTVSTRSKDNNTRAAATVAIFTALFLTCNLPYCINTILYTVTLASDNMFPGPIFSSVYMYWYSWPVSKVVCVVLNATLNPVLYYFRMSKFSAWVRHKGEHGESELSNIQPVRTKPHLTRRATSAF